MAFDKENQNIMIQNSPKNKQEQRKISTVLVV